MLIRYAEILKNSICGYQHYFQEKAEIFAKLAAELSFFEKRGQSLNETIVANITAEVALLYGILAENNSYKHAIRAMLTASFTFTAEERITLHRFYENLCNQCLYACSEVAAADEVYAINSSGTGKRHKLKKFEKDSDI